MVLQRPTCWEARRKPWCCAAAAVACFVQCTAIKSIFDVTCFLTANLLHVQAGISCRVWTTPLRAHIECLAYAWKCRRPNSRKGGARAVRRTHNASRVLHKKLLRYVALSKLCRTWPFRSLMHLSSAEATLGRRPRSHLKMISNTDKLSQFRMWMLSYHVHIASYSRRIRSQALHQDSKLHPFVDSGIIYPMVSDHQTLPWASRSYAQAMAIFNPHTLISSYNMCSNLKR